MTDHQGNQSNEQSHSKKLRGDQDSLNELLKQYQRSQIEAQLETVWLEDEAEFEWWCWRQIRKGRGLDCSVGGSAKTEFKGIKCIKCDFVLVNPGEERFLDETLLTKFADDLMDEKHGDSIDFRDPKTRRARKAVCPMCNALCFLNLLPRPYSPADGILAFVFRMKRRFSTTK